MIINVLTSIMTTNTSMSIMISVSIFMVSATSLLTSMLFITSLTNCSYCHLLLYN